MKSNIADLLKQNTKKHPYKRAIVFPYMRDKLGRVAYTQLTFKQLDQESDCYAHGLAQAGISRGSRTLVELPFSTDLFCYIFALFKVGAVPILFSPLINQSLRLKCIRSTRIEALIGKTNAQLQRVLHPACYKHLKSQITYGPQWLWGGTKTEAVRVTPWKPYEMVSIDKDEPTLIYFYLTTTGHPRQVIYAQQQLRSQIEKYRSHLNFGKEEIDLPSFPFFGLLDILMGMTMVIPGMDDLNPAVIHPEKAVEAIFNHGISHIFASPEFLDLVGRYGRDNNLKLSSLKRIVLTDTPVPPEIIERFSSLLNDEAQIHMPFSASVATPVAEIEGKEFLLETTQLSQKGFGQCIGLPYEDTDLKLIQISDQAIDRWSEELVVAQGEIGEITAKAPHIASFIDDAADSMQQIEKIKDNGGYRLRLGNLGWMDKMGRIWYCGEKRDRITVHDTTLYTLPCEALFNNHSRVAKSALVGIGTPNEKHPVLFVELVADNELDKKIIEKELLDIAHKHAMTQFIETIIFHKALPMTANYQICRKTLTAWAQKIRNPKNSKVET